MLHGPVPLPNLSPEGLRRQEEHSSPNEVTEQERLSFSVMPAFLQRVLWGLLGLLWSGG